MQTLPRGFRAGLAPNLDELVQAIGGLNWLFLTGRLESGTCDLFDAEGTLADLDG
jgi:hypothetical protein